MILLCLLPLGLAVPSVAQDSAGPEVGQEPASPAEAVPREGISPPGTETLEAAYQFALAKMLVEESAFREAQDAFERALELDGSDPYSFLEVAKFHSDMAGYSRSAERRRHQLLRAAEHAGEAVQLAPEDNDILFQYAQIHFRLGEYQLASLNTAQETLEKLRGASEGDIQLLITLGQIYFMKRQPDKAADVLQEAASHLPNHRMLQNMLVDALFGAGRLEEGREALAKLVEIDPTNLEERLRLAELRRENGDPRGAVEVLRAAPPENRDDVRLQQALAHALYLIGDNAPALGLAEKLIEKLPDPEEMKRLRASILTSMARYHDAISEFRSFSRNADDPDRRIQDSVLLSRLLERVGRPDDAIEVLRSLVAEGDDGTSLQLELTLAGTLERHGRGDEAIAMLEKSFKAASPEQLGIYGTALSEILDDTERPDEALRVLEETAQRARDAGKESALTGIDLRKLGLLASHERWQDIVDWTPSLFDHENADLRSAAERLHAQSLAALGRVEEALDFLTAVGAKRGDERQVTVTRVGILFEHEREDEAQAVLEKVIAGGAVPELFFAARLYQQAEQYGRVVELMERLLEEEPESLQALFLLGAAYERDGRLQESIATFRRLLELQPDHAPTLNYLGYMWSERSENLEEALALVLRAVALDPDNGAYVDSLGWVYYQLGRYEEAREHLEWAALLVPTDATIYEHLGDLYLRLGRRARARDHYEQAVELGGENLEAVRRKLESLDRKGP